jgi:hypothetical protein
MKSLSELFEYLSNSTKETIITELTDHCDRLVQKNGKKSITPFKIEVENLKTLFRLSEWYSEKELPRMIEGKTPNQGEDKVMTVEQISVS